MENSEWTHLAQIPMNHTVCMERGDPLIWLYEAFLDMCHLSQLLPLIRDSYVDANPQQEEEDSKAHEE